MKLIKSKKGLALLSVLTVALVAAVSATAYWSNGGSGSGTAAAGSAGDNLVISASGWAGIQPGQTKDVDIKIDNSANSYSSHVDNIVLDTSGITIDAGHSGCDPSWFSYDDSNGNINANLAAGSDANANVFPAVGSLTFHDELAIDQNACKGASITVHLKVSNL